MYMLLEATFLPQLMLHFYFAHTKMPLIKKFPIVILFMTCPPVSFNQN